MYSSQTFLIWLISNLLKRSTGITAGFHITLGLHAECFRGALSKCLGYILWPSTLLHVVHLFHLVTSDCMNVELARLQVI